MDKTTQICEFLDKRFGETGLSEGGVKNLSFYRTECKNELQSVIYQPSLCVVFRGAKELKFGENILTYGHFQDVSRFLLVATHIPVGVKIVQTPFLCATITFEPSLIVEVLQETGAIKGKGAKKVENMYFGDASETLLGAIYRFILLSGENPSKYAEKLATKEILSHLLEGGSGEFLRQYVKNGTIENKIAQIIKEIRINFNKNIDIDALSTKFDISASTLYHNFKRITNLSPLQFQKRVRLEEAKYLLSSRQIDASEAAFEVGYESPSQFSREYARLFGMPPKAHAQVLRARV